MHRRFYMDRRHDASSWIQTKRVIGALNDVTSPPAPRCCAERHLTSGHVDTTRLTPPRPGALSGGRPGLNNEANVPRESAAASSAVLCTCCVSSRMFFTSPICPLLLTSKGKYKQFVARVGERYSRRGLKASVCVCQIIDDLFCPA